MKGNPLRCLRIPGALVVSVAAVFFGSGYALADPINEERPFNPRLNGVLTLFSSPTQPPPRLNDLIAGINKPVANAVNNQIAPALFRPLMGTPGIFGSPTSTLSFEFAGGANTNVFGIYEASDPTNKVPIFGGPESAGASHFLSFTQAPAFNVSVDGNPTPAASNFMVPFGFYLDHFGDDDPTVLDYTLFSEDSLNPGGQPQALIYQGRIGSGTTPITIDIDGFSGPFGPDRFLVVFEDRPLAQVPGVPTSDRDFIDLAVVVGPLQPVPEPTSMLLLGTGLVALGAWRAKKASATKS